MNLIQRITSTKENTLSVILDDQFITVHHLGLYEDKRWYSWSTWGPTEGTIPDYDSQLVTEKEIIERIELLSGDDELDSVQKHAINVFFGKSVL